MELSGVVFHPIQHLSGAGFGTHTSKSCFSALSTDAGNRSSGELRFLDSRGKRVSVRPRKFSGFSSSGFTDYGHVQYYVSPRCATKKEKKNSEIATTKKKLKLLKGLSRGLSMFSSMGFGIEVEDGLTGEINGKKFSEAAEILLAQLQQLRAEEKELKRKRKEEKARVKATQKSIGADCESTSSSSESSDNECGEMVNMSCLRNGFVGETKEDVPQEAIPVEASLTSPSLLIQEQKAMRVEVIPAESTLTNPSLLIQEPKITQVEVIEDRSLLNCGQDCCTGSRTSNTGSSIGGLSVAMGTSNERIEVCMGGKCKKSGAVALLEEFQRRVGREGAVVGCKCMGKCRDGPNVRILNQCSMNLAEGVDGSVRLPTNPLCIGVGLEDVGVIVANFFGEEKKDLGLIAA